MQLIFLIILRKHALFDRMISNATNLNCGNVTVKMCEIYFNINFQMYFDIFQKSTGIIKTEKIWFVASVMRIVNTNFHSATKRIIDMSPNICCTCQTESKAWVVCLHLSKAQTELAQLNSLLVGKRSYSVILRKQASFFVRWQKKQVVITRKQLTLDFRGLCM